MLPANLPFCHILVCASWLPTSVRNLIFLVTSVSLGWLVKMYRATGQCNLSDSGHVSVLSVGCQPKATCKCYLSASGYVSVLPVNLGLQVSVTCQPRAMCQCYLSAASLRLHVIVTCQLRDTYQCYCYLSASVWRSFLPVFSTMPSWPPAMISRTICTVTML
jgi:hypothetical protein